MSCQGMHGTGRVLQCDDHKGHAGRVEAVGQLSEGAAAKIRSGAAPQEMQSEDSGSGNGAGAIVRGPHCAVGLSNELQNLETCLTMIHILTPCNPITNSLSHTLSHALSLMHVLSLLPPGGRYY